MKLKDITFVILGKILCSNGDKILRYAVYDLDYMVKYNSSGAPIGVIYIMSPNEGLIALQNSNEKQTTTNSTYTKI